MLINRKGCEVLGWPESEIVGKNWFDHFIPESVRETIQTRFANMLAGELGDLEYFENPVLTRSGDEHLIAWYNRVLKDQDGEITGVLSSGEDITERRAVDEELRRHTEMLALFNSLNDSLNRGSNLKEIIDLLVEGTQQLFSCIGATVYLLQNDQTELVMQNIMIPQPVLEQIEQLIGMPLPVIRFSLGSVANFCQVIEENRPRLLEDMEEIQAHMGQIIQAAVSPNKVTGQLQPPSGAELAELMDIRSIMIVPLMAGDRPIGLLDISRRKVFSQKDLDRFAAIAQPLSAAIQRKQTDDALRESESRYRQLFENAPVGLGIADEQARLIDYNSAMLQPGGYSRADIEKIGKVSELYADPEIRTRTMELVEHQGYVHRHPVRFKRKDQTAYDALLSLTPIYVNGTRYWQAMVEDLSARQASEQQLLLQATVLKAAANAIVITDRQGDITWVNPAFTHLTGYSAEEVLGQNPRILNSGSHDAAFYAELWATIQSGEVWQGQLINRKKNGDLYTEEMTITPVRGDDGEINHFIAVKQDISDRVLAEEETRRRNQELTLLNRVIAAASSTLEPEPILEIICGELAAAFGVPQAAATLLRESGDELEVVAEYLAEGRPSALGAVIPLEGNPATQHVLETKAPLAVDEAQTDPRMAPIHLLMQERGTVSLLILPLVVRKQVIGTIGLDAIEARCFSKAEIDLAAAVASTAAQAIDTARLFAETRRRAGELEAVAEVSSAMRTAATRAEMYPIILNQLLFLLQADGAKLALRDPGTGEIVTQLARGAWASRTGERQPRGEGLIGRVIDSGRPYLNNACLQSPPDGEIEGMADLHALACVPLIASEQAIGAICVGRQDPFNEEDLNLLNAICDMTANAIHRASLYEQTERRLQRLGALRMIDEAITASVDLRLTLNILLEQVANQLNIDAAAVLLLSPHTKVLEVAARRGFHTGALRNTRLRLGESDAGRAALMRQVIHVPDLSVKATDIGRAAVLAREGFMDYFAVPLIAKGQVKGVLEIFNRQRIATEPEWLDFLETLAGRAAIAIDNISLFDSLQRSNVELMLAYDATIEGWARALELRDRETKGHSQRVTELTLQLASVLGLTEVELEHTRRGTLLHDIGKMGIPDQILNKPGPLTDQEWEIMRQHPVYAYNMLTPIAYLRPALDIPYCHHEKWDGSGYPRGLAGEQIPLTARIFAVVDVWDALRSDRPYRPAWPEQKALNYIKSEAGKHFDPLVVKEFLKLVNHQ